MPKTIEELIVYIKDFGLDPETEADLIESVRGEKEVTPELLESIAAVLDVAAKKEEMEAAGEEGAAKVFGKYADDLEAIAEKEDDRYGELVDKEIGEMEALAKKLKAMVEEGQKPQAAAEVVMPVETGTPAVPPAPTPAESGGQAAPTA